MPYLTPFTGIYLKEDDQLPLQKQQLQRQEILEDLISQLPEASYFEQKLQFSLRDWVPFYWAGFREKTHYTFRFDNPDPEEIYNNLSVSFRKHIRAAERKFAIDVSNNPSGLYTLVKNVFDLRKQSIPYSEKYLNNIIQTLDSKNQCAIYRASDSTGVVTTILTVWDSNTTYYLVGGRSGKSTRKSGNLLFYRAIQDAAARGHHFDFEGSMMKGVHRLFQSFGATMVPYHYIYRYKGVAKLKNLL